VSVSGLVERFSLRQPGAILLVSCYELGHQRSDRPRWDSLSKRGTRRQGLDIAVEKVDLDVSRTRDSSGSPCRCTPPYASASAWPLVRRDEIPPAMSASTACTPRSTRSITHYVADSVIGGEYGSAARATHRGSEQGHSLANVEGVSHAGKIIGPHLKRLPFAVPSRNGLPALERSAS